VPNKFFYEWLEEHYVNLLKTTIRRELGDRGRLEYQILMSHTNGNGHPPPKTNGNDNKPAREGIAPGMIDTQAIKNPFVIPGIKKIKVDPQINPNYLFENYIEGD